MLLHCFRPLPGDLISQSQLTIRNCWRCRVSVPFPGILFLNDWAWLVWRYGTRMFPSPSRGSYFSIIKKCNNGTFDSEVSVPFPVILFLNTLLIIVQRQKSRNRFRPLPGDLISQFLKETQSLRKEFMLFPSPSRGSYFSIVFIGDVDQLPSVGFRPLPGDLISQLSQCMK